MSILFNNDTKVVLQGITGKEGRFHTKKMLDYGTDIVAGVTPGKYGEEVEGIPVYDTVHEARENHDIDTSVIFVPDQFALEAVYEAVDAGMEKMVLITEGIPVHDAMRIKSMVDENDVTLIGPNTPGVVTIGECKLGILDTNHVKQGKVGVISRSGTLTTEVTANLVEEGFGQSTMVGIGGDPVIGSTFIDILKLFEADEDTEAVVMVGEVGGTMEEEAATFIAEEMSKPVAAFIAGRNVPAGKKLGHAGAIVDGDQGTAESKIEALSEAGVEVADVPWQVGECLKKLK